MFFFFLVKKEEQAPIIDDTSNTNSGTVHSIDVTVRHLYSNTLDSLLLNAKVDIYSTDQDRTNATNVSYSAFSDVNGKCVFNHVAVGNYFLVISKDTLQAALEEVTITENTAKGVVEGLLY